MNRPDKFEDRALQARAAGAGVRSRAGIRPYRAPWWLPGPHTQTVYPACYAPRERVAFVREVWTAADGDWIGIDTCGADGRAGAGSAATVLLFHGLEGSSQSHYALALMNAVAARGWRGLVVHWRGCGGLGNRAPRAYHSGDSEEADWIIRRVHRGCAGPLYAVGVSLGGNVLLKWLGERGEEGARLLAGAAAVSVPFDLAAGSRMLERGVGRLYGHYFLSTMKPKAFAMLQEHPGLFDAAKVRAARTLREFDDAFTAPVHGFRNAADYYARSSCKRFLAGIRAPTLLVSARNDPFLPAHCLPAGDELSAAITPVFPASGGHAGFCSGPPPGRFEWLTASIIEFFLHSTNAHYEATDRNI
jgi:uncharacterized protein